MWHIIQDSESSTPEQCLGGGKMTDRLSLPAHSAGTRAYSGRHWTPATSINMTKFNINCSCNPEAKSHPSDTRTTATLRGHGRRTLARGTHSFLQHTHVPTHLIYSENPSRGTQPQHGYGSLLRISNTTFCIWFKIVINFFRGNPWDTKVPLDFIRAVIYADRDSCSRNSRDRIKSVFWFYCCCCVCFCFCNRCRAETLETDNKCYELPSKPVSWCKYGHRC